MGFLPHAISNATTPKLYTSDSLVALHVPGVPARAVVCAPFAWSTSLASPKSPSLALNSESSMMLLDLMSLCTTHCSHSSCKYSSAAAKPRAMLYLTVHPSRFCFLKR
ncbi:hypothetical protein Ahy_A03g011804 [Arachis hypogaea]|uniref:Uncharacterized protein n=1 Tax=Arachis hypogaea TaxID=3818 RepID=A0A445DRW1_ARAHY|nr:hypothetical protein Ahy_A03g011804 [Arachis hypogaea]